MKHIPTFNQFLNESALNEARSINKIHKEWAKVTTTMKETVESYKTAEGKEKDKLLAKLKELSATKRKLEYELDSAVGLKDADIELKEAEKIAGGLSDGMTLSDIAKHHGVDVDVLQGEYKEGVKVEMEHTSDEEIAGEVARDHLYEDPKYYSKLSTIEDD